MNKLSIKQKMLLMAVIACISFITLVALNSRAIEALNRYHQISVLSVALNADMLMLRRHEKDFLARQDM